MSNFLVQLALQPFNVLPIGLLVVLIECWYPSEDPRSDTGRHREPLLGACLDGLHAKTGRVPHMLAPLFYRHLFKGLEACGIQFCQLGLQLRVVHKGRRGGETPVRVLHGKDVHAFALLTREAVS